MSNTAVRDYLSKIGRKGGKRSTLRKSEAARRNALKRWGKTIPEPITSTVIATGTVD